MQEESGYQRRVRGRKRRHPIGVALGQQRPGDARHLVGQRHRDHLERFAFEKLCEQRILLRLMARVSRHCAGSGHQNSSQIAIAPFRDRPELLFAASQVFARHEPDPGREVTTRSKIFGSGTVAAIAVAPIRLIRGCYPASNWSWCSGPSCKPLRKSGVRAPYIGARPYSPASPISLATHGGSKHGVNRGTFAMPARRPFRSQLRTFCCLATNYVQG